MTFDSEAATYDDAFTNTIIGRHLRERVQARLLKHFAPGDRVLELGCGTGEDARLLAQHGIYVTATDASVEMLSVAQSKLVDNPLINFAQIDLANLPDDFDGNYDGVFANFGPLNCISDWQPLAAWLAERVKPGGVVAFGVMAPFCVWEVVWHSIHLEFGTALRRFRNDAAFIPADAGESDAIRIAYPTPSRLTADLALYFEKTHISPLGIALPPSDAFGSIEKRPQVLKFLLRWERRLSGYSQLAMFADHYWIEFQRPGA